MSIVSGSQASAALTQVTTAELGVTYLARDNFPGMVWVSDIGWFAASTGTMWKRLDTLAQIGAADPSYSVEALALFGRMTAQPTDNVKLLIDQCIMSLIAKGYWSRLDALVMPGADVQQSCLNWKADKWNATVQGTVSFTPYLGFLGNGTDFYLDSGFDPIAAMAAGSNFQRDSLSFGGGIQDTNGSTSKNRTIMGMYTGTANAAIDILPDNGGTNLTAFKIGSAANLVGTTTLQPHHWAASRTSASNVALYVDGSPLYTSAANASQAWLDDGLKTTVKYAGRATLAAGVWSTARLSVARHSYFFIGGGFTDAEMLDLNYIFNAYLSATGSEELLSRTITPTMAVS